jgi:hypothetical protein
MHKSLALIALSTVVLSSSAFAEDKPPAPPPEVKKTVDALAGKWKHEGTVTMPGQPAIKFSEKFDCKRISGGRGVSCTDIATVPGMGKLDFTHLVAYDVERKAVHWFAVGSTGEVHDHTCHWKTETRLECDPLKATMGGSPITEEVAITVEGAKQTWAVSITGKEGVTKMATTGKRTSK